MWGAVGPVGGQELEGGVLGCGGGVRAVYGGGKLVVNSSSGGPAVSSL